VRLTWKLSLAVGLGILVVLSGHAWVRVERDRDRFLDDLKSDHRTVGRALATAVELLGAREGEDRARALVDEVNRREPDIALRWVQLGANATPRTEALRGTRPRLQRRGDVESFTTTLDDGEIALVTYVTLRVPTQRVSAIEIVEPLRQQPVYEREAISRTASTTAIVVVICIAIILGFGVVFVGRPLNVLRDHARRVGRGERAIQTRLSARDEIGELAREMNAMTTALDDARDRARSEEMARLSTLAQLRHADRLRVVGEIASSVAHDLGTPMSTVRARAQMIAGAEVDLDRSRALASKIIDEIDRMSARIRQLLDHARRSGPAHETLDVGQWAAEVIDLLRPVAERRRVDLELELEDAGVARLDAAQLRHVLINLVTNAIDASPEGERVGVSIACIGEALHMEVSDAGPGIPEDQRTEIFEPFFTTKAPGEGTGLGLSIARGIVEEHGGTITALSGERGGMTFVVVVPFGDDRRGGTEGASSERDAFPIG
jgi:two-component system NtrC family sensor kinase